MKRKKFNKEWKKLQETLDFAHRKGVAVLVHENTTPEQAEEIRSGLRFLHRAFDRKFEDLTRKFHAR